MSDGTLRPCPFFHPEKDYIGKISDKAFKRTNLPYLKYLDGYYYVFCQYCYAKGPMNRDKELAVKLWNTRTSDKQGEGK